MQKLKNSVGREIARVSRQALSLSYANRYFREFRSWPRTRKWVFRDCPLNKVMMNCKGNTGYKFMVSAGFEYCNAEVKERLEDEIGYLFVRFSRLSLKFLSVVVAVTATVCLLTGKILANITNWQAVNRIGRGAHN